MSLIVIFENITDCAPISDYRVSVYVNKRLIAGPFYVKKHKREKGWKALIKKFVRLPDTKTLH